MAGINTGSMDIPVHAGGLSEFFDLLKISTYVILNEVKNLAPSVLKERFFTSFRTTDTISVAMSVSTTTSMPPISVASDRRSE